MAIARVNRGPLSVGTRDVLRAYCAASLSTVRSTDLEKAEPDTTARNHQNCDGHCWLEHIARALELCEHQTGPFCYNIRGESCGGSEAGPVIRLQRTGVRLWRRLHTFSAFWL